ncbi:MAG TPA: hypothetical protein VK821_20615 [Dehalococcoidia bacterium]|nr:hypothetical protein [Dehalococcoidia bacterium]
MTDGAKWLELAAGSMDLLGLVAAGWYVGSRYRERVFRDADRNLSFFGESASTEGSSRASRPDSVLLTGQPMTEADEETDAEQLLAAGMARFQQPFLNTFFGWWERKWRSVATHGWPAIALLAPVGLVLLAAMLTLCALLLPLVAVRYLLDTGQDFRLRIIVLAFMLGIALQILGATIG